MAVLRGRRVAPAIVLLLVFLGACARRHAVDDCDNPFPQIVTRSATLPSTLPPADGGARVIGSVAASATHHAIKGAMVLLYSSAGRDTTIAYTDSAGGFATRLPSPGRHTYSVRSVGFSMVRGSIDLSRGTETLTVTMRHGPWLCDVRLTTK
jgi:hypothetical protein